MKRTVRLRAFAKANLSLNITGRCGGRHEIESVMASVDLFDTVTITERADKKINVRFTNADIGENNTAYKAAVEVFDKLDNGVDIVVEKGIPIAAGLGGSSASAAAVLRGLDVLYNLPSRGVNMRAAALKVGSDVPFMLTGGLARVTGVGDELFFINNKLNLFAVGIMCGEVSTAACYREFDNIYSACEYSPTDTDELCNKLLDADCSVVSMFDNALYAPCARLLPEVTTAYQTLENFGAKPCLTGSGGMVIGWFTDIDAFYNCTKQCSARTGFRTMTLAPTGVLHEWINK